MQTESTWKKQKSMLDEDASNISILKKQITKEAEIDASVQSSINEKVDNLKQSATVLAKKLENEKHKNAELELIIKHMRGNMEKQRIEASNAKGNFNAEDLNSLQNRFKKLEYDLGQVNGKVNRMSENLEQKKSKISQNRTQRVIDSGIFRNIEKQLINSELHFKKLLIEKIKYQKQYEKIMQEYQSLKEKAQTYYFRKDTTRSKAKEDKESIPSEIGNESINFKKKFLEVEAPRSNNRYTTYCKIDEEIERQEEKQAMKVKKMLIETNLENCSDLLYYFQNIEEINEKYFNQINIYADQSNEIQKYLDEVVASNKRKKLRFSTERPSLTKKEINRLSKKDREARLSNYNASIDEELQQLVTLFDSEHFKVLLSNLGIENSSFVEDGHANFDKLEETLKHFDRSVSQYLRQPVKIEEEQVNTSRNTQGSEKLEDMINKVRKNDECLKVMKKEQFKDEYQKLIKNINQKSNGGRTVNKKKSFPMLKK